MNPDESKRRYGCILGSIGLVFGLVIGFSSDFLLEAVTGDYIRRGLATDMQFAGLRALVGGAIGLIGGSMIGAFLGSRSRSDKQ